MSVQTDIIRKGRKFDEVLEGAERVFFRDGFEGASVDDIAKEAGVSKATLYSYFPDKRALFLEIISQRCQSMANSAFQLDIRHKSAREILTLAASVFVDFLLTPFTIRLHNLILGESERFPELAQKFYEAGPQYGKNRLVEVLKELVRRGELEINDFEFAAEQFGSLCKSEIWMKCCLCQTMKPSEADIQKIVNGTVDMFMARYGVTC